MDIFLAILIFVVVVVVSALVFGGWVIVAVIRLLARAIGGAPRAPLPPARAAPPRVPQGAPWRVVCAQPNCRAANPSTARFCRRCGRDVAGPVQGRGVHVVRRVAMW